MSSHASSLTRFSIGSLAVISAAFGAATLILHMCFPDASLILRSCLLLLAGLTACSLVVAFATRRSPALRGLAARFFNIYGPGETNPHLIPDILSGLAAGTSLKLGNLEPLRDYIYVDDIVEAVTVREVTDVCRDIEEIPTRLVGVILTE